MAKYRINDLEIEIEKLKKQCTRNTNQLKAEKEQL